MSPTLRSIASPALLLASTLLVVACAGSSAGSPRPAPEERAVPGVARVPQSDTTLRRDIEAMMRRAARAWNRGDLDVFMSDYLDSPRTTYVTKERILRGRDAIRQVYESRFAPGATRDSLSFTGLDVDALAPDVAHVIAFYVLARGDSVTSRGPTSLVVERHEGRWVIVHDHSS